ncbi:MAG TPA: FixH family protein [Noviherbaspirillum sp.]|nr:FixH family protein [Noviherbaspirillum sp.]
MQASAPITNHNRPAPWYRHRWPWLLMIGPAAVVVAGIHTTWIAFSHQDALVTGDYYKQGKAINQDLRRAHAAAALKLEVNLRYDPAAGRLLGTVDSDGRPLESSLIVTLNHSTLPEKDVRLLVYADAEGRFAAPLPMLDMARWIVTVEDAQRDWRMAGRWLWPQNPALQILAETPVLPD